MLISQIIFLDQLSTLLSIGKLQIILFQKLSH